MISSIVVTTYPDVETAARASKTLVKKKLAACANIADIRSIYLWKGKLEDIRESLVIMKTRKSRVPQLRKAIEKSHPYEVPEIAEIPVASLNEKYLDWLNGSVR